MKIKIFLCIIMMLLIHPNIFAQQKIYACTSGQQIYSVNLVNCSSQLIGPSGTDLYDIAVTSNGQIWGIASPGYLYKIDTLNGAATFIGVMGFNGNSLVDLNDSTLLMAGGSNLYKVNVGTAAATFIGTTGFYSDGDLTWYDNDLYIVAASGGIVVTNNYIA